MKLLLMMAFIATAAFSLKAADLTGTWKASMETQMGKTDVALTLTPGTPLAGKVNIADYVAPLENAKLDGDKLTFEINLEHGKVAFDGTVAGDEIKFTVTGTQGDKYSLVCKRQK